MVTFPMTLTSFQGHGIFEIKYLKKVTIAHSRETIPNKQNGAMFGDLD